MILLLSPRGIGVENLSAEHAKSEHAVVTAYMLAFA